MAQCTIEITVRTEWRKMPSDGRQCIACERPIVGDMYLMHAIVNGQGARSMDYAACEACYEASRDQA